jgi:hypothetical protein
VEARTRRARGEERKAVVMDDDMAAMDRESREGGSLMGVGRERRLL